MRILWISNAPGLYANTSNYNGCGWVTSLQHGLSTQMSNSLQLGIAFPWKENIKTKSDTIVYYGIKKLRLRQTFFSQKKYEQLTMVRLKEIVNDFKPDLIHIFGSEHLISLISEYTEIPTVLHLQGILSAYRETWLPEGMSWFKFYTMQPRQIIDKIVLNRGIKRELRIFKSCQNYMGRTDWDYSISQLLSPNSNYFYCNETLRPIIYNSSKIWNYHNRTKIIITSLISSPIYKGGDLVLRAANYLKNYTNFDFEWNIYGTNDISRFEKLTHIKANNVNVKACGIITAEKIVDIITDSDIYVHPSYIENSPNSVCEAQLLGVPVIATNVGGVSSLISNEKNGILVPANDPYYLAYKIKQIISNKNLAIKLGTNGRETALERHNPKQIVNELISIYQQIILKNKRS